MAGRGRGKRLTDSERMEIITRLEAPETQVSKAMCAREYGVTPAAISKLMKVRHSVKKRYSDAGADSGALRDKRQRGGFSKNVPFEDELFQWICSVRARPVPLLVTHVQQKAKLLAARHKMKEDFKASNGWYYRFCGRYGLTPASLHAGASTPMQSPSGAVSSTSTLEGAVETKRGATDEWTALRQQVAQFGPEFVYTVSEARLFYQELPRAVQVTAEHGRDVTQGSTTMIADAAGAMENGSSSKTPRVLVMVCVNGTGTHKVPLLVVGREQVPLSLAALHPQLLRDDVASIYNGVAMGASYCSQREVWCDDRTFRHWCERVFLPAVRQRTTQRVLLVAENPGGRLAGFQQENVSTEFLPLRTRSEPHPEAAVGEPNAGTSAQGHQLHGAVVRDLKRRYRIGLFQERLNFLETPEDEKYRLVQRASKKPAGSAGVALGRVPHLIDAMNLLDEAWAAVTPELIKTCWPKSSVEGSSSTQASAVPAASLEQSDDALVQELGSMLRNANVVSDTSQLARELRQWLRVDDDSSEQMQQQLLCDIQQILQEEEQPVSGEEAVAGQLPAQQMQFQLQQQQNAAAFMATTDLPATFDPNQAGAYAYRADKGHPAAAPPMDPNVAQTNKRKAIDRALQALARAEEAMDNVDVAEFFGEEAAGQAMESIARALRRLRRMQCGKQSALVAAAVNAAASGDTNDSTGGALSTHEYFYGNGAFGRNA
jgi:hypothetical protein